MRFSHLPFAKYVLKCGNAILEAVGEGVVFLHYIYTFFASPTFYFLFSVYLGPKHGGLNMLEKS